MITPGVETMLCSVCGEHVADGSTHRHKPTTDATAALAAALQAWWHLDMPGMPGCGSWEAAGGWENDAEDILAALDGWTLVPSDEMIGARALAAALESKQTEIARLRAALSFHNKTPTGMTRKCLPGCVACAALAGGSDGS